MSFHKQKFSRYTIKHSQNFIKSPIISSQIVNLARFNKNDIVIEIGPGKGALTKFILPESKKVFAVEKDNALFSFLCEEFKESINLELINKDFLNYDLPHKFDYKVIGNIPFGLTTEILKKILESNNKPTEVCLIIQKEAALRFLGSDCISGKESLFSLRFKPFFSGEIIRSFSRNDFAPKPTVDIVMLHISKRKAELIRSDHMIHYLDFITFCFTAWKRNVEEILREVFTNKEIAIIKKESHINLQSKPSEIDFDSWLALFNFWRNYSSQQRKERINGSFARLNIQQNSLVKSKRTRVHLSRFKVGF